MNKVLIATTFAILSGAAFATENPMFGVDTKNSIALNIAQSTGSHNIRKLVWFPDWEISPQTFVMLTYAQPMEILRLPSRMNISVVQNIAYESSKGLSFIGVGASWDIALVQYHGFYLGIGIGPYYRDNHDRWVSSRFMFGEKVFLGKNITDRWHGELFTIHFSNGDLTEINHGFNFVGIGVNYSF
ncbi:MAG: acyloxyacyl hydrolase [Alphaproteobacteria bacterium]|nr:acyloxyacyl hydrolase [Alphaproteobacteria bacterium]